jgi:hypothetical protein
MQQKLFELGFQVLLPNAMSQPNRRGLPGPFAESEEDEELQYLGENEVRGFVMLIRDQEEMLI